MGTVVYNSRFRDLAHLPASRREQYDTGSAVSEYATFGGTTQI